MSLEDLGNIGEFVGAIAVVFSLIYLAFNIRQNTRQLGQNAELLRLSGRQAVKRDMQDIRLAGLQNADLVDLVRRGLADLSTFTETEKAQFGLFMALVCEMYLFVWDFREQDPVNWEIHKNNMRAYLSQPSARSWWENNSRQLYPEPFVRHIDDLVLTEPEPSAPHWLRG
jgi:hypothetical protein